MSAGEILWAGLTALAGPGLAVTLTAVVAGAAVFGPRRRRLGHLLAGLVLAVVYAVALGRGGFVGFGATGVVVGLALGPALVVLWWQEETGPPLLSALTGLVVGALAVLWRLDLYGPVLAELRGGWQAPVERSALFLYHLGTATGLWAVWSAVGELARRLPRRPVVAGALLALVVLTVLRVAGAWPGLERVLLLHWPEGPGG